MTEPTWLTLARAELGVTESLGPNDSPWIRRMWGKAGWLLGQPWCGGALAFWMQGAGISFPKAYYRAKAWLEWGITLAEPVVGCVGVFDRKGGGHVGIVTGRDASGHLLVIGGNQSDAIRISAFSTDRVLGYRWPVERDIPYGALPVLASSSQLSTNEA
jgi:uncharacterized protein (TIGR02594 family)